MDRSRLFDLNELPDEDINIHDTEVAQEEIPLFVRSCYGSNLVVDLNVQCSEDVEQQSWELNMEYINEEEEGDQSEEEGEEEGDQSEEEGAATSGNNIESGRKRKFISNIERERIYSALLEKSINGKLQRGTTTQISTLFSVNIRSVQRIWKRGRTNQGNVSHRKTKNVGRKRIQIDFTRLHEIHLNQRTTLRSVAAYLKVSPSTVYKRLLEGLIRRHSNAIKPHLKEEHKRARLQFCLSMLDSNSLPHDPKFIGMYNFVHIDEKWFYVTKKTQRYYLSPMEADPLRSCQSKNYVGKVMSLVAMARPRFDDAGNEIFSGKIGVFPLVYEREALRRSRHREAGTVEIKPITSVTRETIRTTLLEKVIPKLCDVWPEQDSRSTIYIQQDNARTHVNPNDAAFQSAASQNGFDIRLLSQPANSPDMNILDLGFFRAIQSLQEKQRTKNIDELIQAVQTAFDGYSAKMVDRVWLTYQLCMIETMRIQGSNRYKIPHIKKSRLEAEGRLPKQISCDPILVQNVISQLQS